MSVDSEVTAVESRLTGPKTELVAVFVIALSTLLSGWTVFQVTEWQRVRFKESDIAAGLSDEAQLLRLSANQLQIRDDEEFTTWQILRELDEEVAERFLFSQLRQAVIPLVAQWQIDEEAGEEPATPFEYPGYDAAILTDNADELTQQAETATERSDEASDISAEYALLSVFTTASLLLAGLVPHFSRSREQRILAGASSGMFLIALILILRLPISI
jgi:hypothetical protein